MKTTSSKIRSEQGTVLFVTLIATAIIGAGLASYLKLVANQNYSVARSQAWNRAIPVLEAGIEEALAQVSKGTTASSMVANGWALSGTNYVKTRNLTEGDRFTAKISVKSRSKRSAQRCPPVVASMS